MKNTKIIYLGTNNKKESHIGAYENLEDGIIPTDEITRSLLFMKCFNKLNKKYKNITITDIVTKRPEEIAGPFELYATYGIKGYGTKR